MKIEFEISAACIIRDAKQGCTKEQLKRGVVEAMQDYFDVDNADVVIDFYRESEDD